MSDTIKTAKKELRREMREKMRIVGQDARAVLSHVACALVVQTEWFKHANIILSYRVCAEAWQDSGVPIVL